MAGSLLLRSRRALLSLASPSTILRNSSSLLGSPKLLIPNSLLLQTRPYISEMRKSAFDSNILRLLRNEIDFELERSPGKPVSQVQSYAIDNRPGEQWITLNRKFNEEQIKIEVTMFDGSVPIEKSTNKDVTQEEQLHITFIIAIHKLDGSQVMEFVCSAWPDSIEIQKVFVQANDQMPVQPYMGPEFKEMDDELQDALYDFLEARGINDELAAFMHGYMRIKDRTECVRWMETLKSFIEKQ